MKLSSRYSRWIKVISLETSAMALLLVDVITLFLNEMLVCVAGVTQCFSSGV